MKDCSVHVRQRSSRKHHVRTTDLPLPPTAGMMRYSFRKKHNTLSRRVASQHAYTKDDVNSTSRKKKKKSKVGLILGPQNAFFAPTYHYFTYKSHRFAQYTCISSEKEEKHFWHGSPIQHFFHVFWTALKNTPLRNLPPPHPPPSFEGHFPAVQNKRSSYSNDHVTQIKYMCKNNDNNNNSNNSNNRLVPHSVTVATAAAIPVATSLAVTAARLLSRGSLGRKGLPSKSWEQTQASNWGRNENK